MKTPLIIFVLANKGGVGKTTVTRALTDYLNSASLNHRVFDTEYPGGSLRRFYKTAKLIDASTTKGLMEVLDNMGHDTINIVDVRAGMGTRTLKLFSDLGMLADAREGRTRLIVLHVLTGNVDSLNEAAEVAGLLAEGGLHYLVKNCATDEPFDWAPEGHQWAFNTISPSGVIEIPHLDGATRTAVDDAGVSFKEFAENEDAYSFTMRRYVWKWLKDVSNQFDKVGLGLAVRGDV
jgi:hypothetical protein